MPNETIVDVPSFNRKTYPGTLLRIAQQMHNTLWARTVGPDITGAQFAVIMAIHQHPGTDQTQLGYHASLDLSTVQSIVMRLVNKGLVTRTRDEHDGRRWNVWLTPKGDRILERLLPAVVRVPALLLEALDELEQAKFVRLLHIVVNSGKARNLNKPSVPSEGNTE